LSTSMVGEFPELQGIIGRYYALNDGEDLRVAEAIAEHYKPHGPDDSCPSAPESVVAALTDKIDSLVAFFAIGERPTGSRDPFALRRAALGLVRLILENRLRFPLSKALETAALQLPRAIVSGNGSEPWDSLVPAIVAQLLAFIVDRLRVHLREQGFRHDVIAAALARAGEREDDLGRLCTRVEALRDFVGSEIGANLLIAYRRASNIVAIEERRDGRRYDREVDHSALKRPEEHALLADLDVISAGANRSLAREEFQAAMGHLASMRGSVDAFFDKVTVNTDDARLRENRLRLLSCIRATMNQVADFSLIEG
jgi:glycyl-tRNA synthetase beta chain